MTARVPCEEIEVGEPELVDEVRHAPRVLVTAMKQHDRAARGAFGRRPVAIEEVDAIVRAEHALLRAAHERGDVGSVVHASVPSANPRRTRLTIVTTSATATTGMT